MSALSIKVVGLNDFRKGLRGIDRGLPKTVRVVLNQVATILIDHVRPQIPRLTGRAAASLKPQSTQSQARIAAGGPSAPWYPWIDFGGRVGPKKSVVRPYIPGGRYIFPGLDEKRADIEDAMLEGMAQLASSNGIEVS